MRSSGSSRTLVADPDWSRPAEIVCNDWPVAELEGELILVRHGESTFNAEQRFTGLLDVPLTAHGQEQCHEAADLLIEADLHPEVVITTPLRRAADTAAVIVERLDLAAPDVEWRLAERDYGWLTNLPKQLVRQIFGEEAFFTWRRTIDGKPPTAPAPLVRSWGELAETPGLGPLQPGMSESLREVIERVRPAWQQWRPDLLAGRHVLVVAHGNSLRALCAVIDDLSDAEVEELNLPSGQPLVYRFAADGSATGRYLDPHTAHARASAVAAEGGT